MEPFFRGGNKRATRKARPLECSATAKSGPAAEASDAGGFVKQLHTDPISKPIFGADAAAPYRRRTARRIGLDPCQDEGPFLDS